MYSVLREKSSTEKRIWPFYGYSRNFIVFHQRIIEKHGKPCDNFLPGKLLHNCFALGAIFLHPQCKLTSYNSNPTHRFKHASKLGRLHARTYIHTYTYPQRQAFEYIKNCNFPVVSNILTTSSLKSRTKIVFSKYSFRYEDPKHLKKLKYVFLFLWSISTYTR